MKGKRLVEKKIITDLDHDQLIVWLSEHAFPSFHAAQLFNWLYSKGATDFDAMTDLPHKLRDSLNTSFFLLGTTLHQSLTDETGVLKFVFSLHDNHVIETVYLPSETGYTLCISSQVGCVLGCRFCATGAMGIVRNLSSGEIVSQVLHAQKITGCGAHGSIVFMGMGEPLLNSDAVIEAIKRITDTRGLGWSPRRVTLSTAGIVPEIHRLGKAGLGVNLAVSLNAADDATRSRIMPINKKYPLKMLISSLNAYPLPSRQHRITCEYVMLQGINDSLQQADKLIRLLNRRRYKINLIPYNATSNSRFKPSESNTILAFQNRLHTAGFIVRIRNSRGSGIQAACGQLAGWQPENQS